MPQMKRPSGHPVDGRGLHGGVRGGARGELDDAGAEPDAVVSAAR